MTELTVRHVAGDHFAIDVHGHTVHIDQPVADGGTDAAPTPTVLFVASLAGCVAFYARRYLARHGIDTDGFEVNADYRMAPRPARVDAISIRITPPPALPADRHDAFLAVATHCTVHNSLEQPPAVRIELGPARVACSAS